mmetsp:Transcript_110688/g.174461  ORF Transcript_110688/g.174461 Transcript_110688/m.174461 type:complete len:404 (+) Transcript_110688:77-1288(+)
MNTVGQNILTFLHLFLIYLAERSHARESKTPAVMQWLTEKGATVHQGMTVGNFDHGGAKVRGVFNADAVLANTTLLVIPRNLLIELSHYPMFSSAALPSTMSCQKAAPTVEALQGIRFAAAIALEISKGQTSFYYPYLKLLPSLQDFHSFLPVLMEQQVQNDYSALPIMAKVKEMQTGYDICRKCFQDWKSAQESPVKQLRWDDVFLGFILSQTRSFGLDGGRTLALVPVADMLNTGMNSELNAQWISTANSFTMHADRPFAAGTEIYDGYCDNCDNALMMIGWGIYLESNPNPSQRGGQSCFGEEGARLKRVSEAALQTKESAAENWLSPRCKASVLDMPQGALRCSLARLSWETCAAEWADDFHHGHLSSLLFNHSYSIISKHAQTNAAKSRATMSFLGHK